MAVDNPNIVTQPYLGKLDDIYKPEDNMGGYLALAKVLTVHHKHNTVDIEILKSKHTITSSDANKEGRFGARLTVSTAHFDARTSTSSGVVEPIQEGQLVVLAFLDGFKNQPIIIGSFHDTWEVTHNVLTDRYPLSPDYSVIERRESLKYLRVSPSQFYHKIDGIGAVETVYPSKSFFKADPDFRNEMSDTHLGFDHKDLSEKDPVTSLTREGKTEESKMPLKYLFVHRSSPTNEQTTWTKFFIDKDGTFRSTRDNNDSKLTYVQMSSTGEYMVRRQNDSPVHGEGTDSLQVSISKEGEYEVTRSIGDNETSMGIKQNGDAVISNTAGSYIKMQPNGDIIIYASGNLVINDD